MPGYIVHIAIGQEYLRKHRMRYSEEFIKGTIAPDLTDDKSKTHYGKSPAYTNLKNFLSENKIDTEYMQGYFLHLIADYLFYNKYLDKIEKPQIYNDYDMTNQKLIDKYNLKVIKEVKDKISFIKGTPKILTLDLANKVIDEISSMDIEKIKKEVKEDNENWNKYKKLV